MHVPRLPVWHTPSLHTCCSAHRVPCHPHQRFQRSRSTWDTLVAMLHRKVHRGVAKHPISLYAGVREQDSGSTARPIICSTLLCA